MSESFGDATFTFRGDDQPFQKAADAVEAKMREAGITNEKWLQQIRASFDQVGGAADKTTAKVATFALNMSILTRVASGLRNVGRAAEEYATKVRLGTASTEELIDKMIEGIPIIGNFWEAGRAVREAITGDKAYTEVLLAQAKAQDERRAALDRYIDATKQLKREIDDLAKGLTQKPGAAFDITGFITGGSRQAEDLSAKLKSRFQKQFDDIAEQRTKLGEKLRSLEEANRPTAVSSGTGGPGILIRPDPGVGKAIADTQRSLRALDEQAAKLRGQMEQFEELTREKIGSTVIAQIMRKVGGEFSHGFDEAGKAIDGYLQRIPKIQSETQKAIDATLTDFQRLGRQLSTFQLDLTKGLIDQPTFQRLSTNAIFSTAIKQVDDIKFSIKSWFFPLEQAANKFIDPVRAFFAQDFKKVATTTPARISFQNLEENDRRIRTAAAQSDPAFRVQQEQLEALKLLGRGGDRTIEELQKIERGLGAVGTVK